MDTQSDWSSEDRYQASGQTPPAGAPGRAGPGGPVPPWSVPPGLLNVTRSAAWREAHADALGEADDPGDAADEQAGQPADEQDAWSANEQDSWPGVAPPAGWFLRRPGENDPSPAPARDDLAASVTEGAAGEWFSPGDGPDADVSEDGYDEHDEYGGYDEAEDDDPLAAGTSPAAEESQVPPGDLESNGPWPVLQPRA